MAKVTYPHMGNMALVVKALFNELGIEFIMPPPITKKTLSLGVQHSPEFACLPLKINIGNFIESAELGADTVIMAGGCGPCRFGYYNQVQKEILTDINIPLDMFVLEPPDTHMGEFIQRLKKLTKNASWWRVMKAIRFAYCKSVALDSIEKETARLRCREKRKGQVEETAKHYINQIDKASSVRDIKGISEEAVVQLRHLPLDWQKKPVRIGLTGEIYALLEPYSSGTLEKKLGELGAEVERSIYLSQWINEHLFKGLAGPKSHKHIKDLAKPYLNRGVGGHGQESVGSAVNYSINGFDGVVHIGPLTCMPEIVAQSIMPRVEYDYKIPILTLYMDEQTGEAGLATRMEAFVDMLERKKAQQCNQVR